MTILDLSHAIMQGMPVYPGTDPPRIEDAAVIQHEGYAEKLVSMFTHTGTHMDAPAHILPEGKTLDQFPVDQFFGPGFVVDVADSPPEVSVDKLRGFEEKFRNCEFLLLHTGWHRKWGSEGYYGNFPVLSIEAATWLGGFGFKGIGIDAISVDPVGSTELPVHRVLLAHNMIIVENLTGIDRLVGKEFLFCCMPLKIERADGSPVRAVAFLAGPDSGR
ncbi:MAG TPA: cyclase family protein [Bacteroidota bacterium]|nr:cyclase family protein [Bacteroidota bacterium]